jgi:hypothetical protein
MTTPDFIWIDPFAQEVVQGKAEPDYDRQYVRRDPAVLAELPEVKALLAAAVEEAAVVVPQGWCAPATAHKEMDVTLGLAIQEAIRALIQEPKP